MRARYVFRVVVANAGENRVELPLRVLQSGAIDRSATYPDDRNMITSLSVIRQRLLLPLGVLATIFTVGTLGFKLIEGWSWSDSLWMAAITLTTTGFGELHALSTGGRFFTIGLMLLGMSGIVYGISVVTGFIVEGELQRLLRRRTMRKNIGKMRGHTIVCGAGRTGLHVIGELAKTKSPFVVIEGNADLVAQLRDEGHHVVQGDATREEPLHEAGIRQAGRLVSCLTDDKDNLFVVLTARQINPALHIVARYNEDHSAEKMRKAGANAVVSPTAIGGLRMASEALRPAVVSFLDVMLRSSKATLRVEQAVVHDKSKLAHKHLKDARIHELTGLLVLAVKGRDGQYAFNPAPGTPLTPGHALIVMGEIDGVKKLKVLAGETA